MDINRAARKGDVAALRRLLDEGASPHELDEHGRTPLHNLLHVEDTNEDDRVACFTLLRDAGANLEARTDGDPHGSTVLHYAANSGSPGVLSLLLEAGVDLNVVNSSNYTPLHWAARGDFRRATECVELLLKADAAVNVVSRHEGTPFDVAITQGHRRAYPLFLRAGAEFRSSYRNPYIWRVQGSGGYRKYAQNHLARMTELFVANGRRLPPEVVRQIMKFWLHLGYY